MNVNGNLQNGIGI
jgi:hypothetical protein